MKKIKKVAKTQTYGQLIVEGNYLGAAEAAARLEESGRMPFHVAAKKVSMALALSDHKGCDEHSGNIVKHLDKYIDSTHYEAELLRLNPTPGPYLDDDY